MSDDSLRLKRFENVTTMIRYHNDKMIEAFNRFISMLVTIIGGAYALLSFEHLDIATKIQAVSLATLALIWSNYKSWYRFREAETKLLGDAISAPTFLRSMSEQLAMTAIIVAVLVAYHVLNPFSSILENSSLTHHSTGLANKSQ
jgi:hypothetical protein